MTDLPAIFNAKILLKSVENAFQEPSVIDPKNTLVLYTVANVQDPPHPMLDKLLQACKINPIDVCKYPVDEQTAHMPWSNLKLKHQPKYVLCFGRMEDFLNINIKMPLHQVHVFDRTIWICTDALTILAGNEELKKHLWNNQLKPVFIDGLWDKKIK